MQRITKPELFKERLKEARENKGLLIKQLAAESKIDLSTVKLYSSGARVPGIGNLNKLAAALDVSPEWLTGETIFKTPIEERFSKFHSPKEEAATKAMNLIFQAIEELAAVKGYNLGIDPDKEVDGGLGYDGTGIAKHLAAVFEHELEKQCEIYLK